MTQFLQDVKADIAPAAFPGCLVGAANGDLVAEKEARGGFAHGGFSEGAGGKTAGIASTTRTMRNIHTSESATVPPFLVRDTHPREEGKDSGSEYEDGSRGEGSDAEEDEKAGAIDLRGAVEDLRQGQRMERLIHARSRSTGVAFSVQNRIQRPGAEGVIPAVCIMRSMS